MKRNRNSRKSPQPFILLAILLLITPSSKCDDLVEQICKKTPFHDLCVASLQPSSGTSDAKGLAATMANLVLSNTTYTLSYIQELIKQNKDPQLERPLANCAELYIPVVKYNIPQAIDALSRGRYGFAKYVFSDTAKQADACEKSLSKDAPLSDMNQLVSNLCQVAVGIISVLLKL